MSMHNTPLTPAEEAGLRAHGLKIGTPSQLSDAFRQGMAYAIATPAQQPSDEVRAAVTLLLEANDYGQFADDMLDQPSPSCRSLGKGPVRDALRLVINSHEFAALAAQAQQPAASRSPDFIRRTNEDYVAWCATFYSPDALDERGMPSLHGLWAWQEQERRKCAGITSPSVK